MTQPREEYPFGLTPDQIEDAKLLGLVFSAEKLSPPTFNAVDQTVVLCAGFWADEHFEADGKQWRLLQDGESIFARNAEPLTRKERKWLDRQAGAIVDVSTNGVEKPMYFEDEDALDRAWEELQETYAVEAKEYAPA
jgi:hypothetical protein